MPKTPTKHPDKQHRVPSAPEPLSASPRDGMESTRAMARRYLPDAIRLLAGIAFGADSEAGLYNKYLATKEIIGLAGAIPQATPPPPQPYNEGDGDVSDVGAISDGAVSDGNVAGDGAAQ